MQTSENTAILCCGDCNVDLVAPIDEIPVKGGCTFGTGVILNVGGTTLNTAVALQRLGMNCGLVSEVGKDLFGDRILEYLKPFGTTMTRYLTRSEYPTGVAIALVAPDGEKYWIAERKNAADIHMHSEKMNAIPLPEVLYVSGVVLVEGKETRASMTELILRAKEAGKTVILDPNIRSPNLTLSPEVEEAFNAILPSVSLLITNQAELQTLGKSAQLPKAAAALLTKGTGAVFAKLGGAGCSCYTQNSSRHYPPAKYPVLDTSGAGDAFNAAVIFAIQRGFSQDQTGVFANEFAGYVVSKYGTTAALPEPEEIHRMIAMTMRMASK